MTPFIYMIFINTIKIIYRIGVLNMEGKKTSINDFESHYIIDGNYITMSAYYMIDNCYYNIVGCFEVIMINSLNIIDKLNLKRSYEKIFRNVVLSKLINAMEGIRPLKREVIPEGAEINKIFPNITLVVKESGWEKYLKSGYPKYNNLDHKDRKEIEYMAKEFFWEDVRYGMCEITLSDIDYTIRYDEDNQWYSSVDHSESNN
jgi:hypothetical protein